jgi:hypothetical protein
MAGKLDLKPVEVVERGQIPDCKNCGNYLLCGDGDYTRCILLNSKLQFEGGYIWQE